MATTGAGIAPSQGDLFPTPRRAVRVDPANLGTADCPLICLCDDSCEYAIKDGRSHPLTPHAEWFCTRLASLVGIAGPDCQVIELFDGSKVFGSRWEGGVVPAAPPGIAPTWVAMVHNGTIPLAAISAALSRIYAFDHFVHNDDRHGNNFLVRQQRTGYALLAFDYSRAWTFHGFPLPRLPFDLSNPAERTVRAQRQLAQIFGTQYIDGREAARVLDNIRRVPPVEIVRIIDSHPKEWFPDSERQAIISWWGSAEMIARTQDIERGIANGAYL
jgi:hypothetical protein